MRSWYSAGTVPVTERLRKRLPGGRCRPLRKNDHNLGRNAQEREPRLVR